MRIILCGVPDTGKYKFYEEHIARKYKHVLSTEDTDVILADMFTSEDETPPSFGLLADYRTELLIASMRAICLVSMKDLIHINSLIDSLAYATTITSLKIQNNDSDLDQWFSVFQFFPQLIADSMMYDLIIRFPYEGDDEMMKILDSNYELVLSNFNLPYISNTDLDELNKKLVEEYGEPTIKEDDSNN